ncbi:FCD domain-containing protein [Enterovirga sp.]|jgi:DNA-binding FadR family transcriptional regulator|uniref:FadR/GntR family transcriptional regulator n=1 Tax=Enterovirga sp. TaxID=2026350 RepID=UPI002628D92A|nr:FCD domain-containing protein [Enterovirga sp.]MDB5591223.1 GntR domain protein [Enterovirga sp.]
MSKTERVGQQLRALLNSNRYPVATRLPPERELSAELGVSRTLLRAELARLEAEGRIWRHVGQGTFVGSRPVNTSTDLALISGLTSPTEVMEVRLVVEPRAARFAAMRATAEDIAHLRVCLDKSNAAPNYSNYGRWDATLHRSIVAASRNVLLLALFDAINTVRQQPAWASLWESALTAERQHRYSHEHGAIVEAVATRQGPEAETAMRRHLQSVARFLSLQAGGESPVDQED